MPGHHGETPKDYGQDGTATRIFDTASRLKCCNALTQVVEQQALWTIRSSILDLVDMLDSKNGWDTSGVFERWLSKQFIPIYFTATVLVFVLFKVLGSTWLQSFVISLPFLIAGMAAVGENRDRRKNSK